VGYSVEELTAEADALLFVPANGFGEFVET